MLNKKILLLFIIVLCFISAVNAKDISNLTKESISESSSHMSEDGVKLHINDNLVKVNIQNKSKSTTNNDINKSSVKSLSNPQSNVTNGNVRVWINRMVIKRNSVIVSLKSNKKGVIYYTTDGSNPTNESKKYNSNIKLSFKKTLKYFVVGKDGVSSKVFAYKRFLGKTSKGYVEKLYYGNLSSNETMALIVGVHVQESGMHKSIQHALKIKSSALNKRFVLYYIHVTKNQNNYDKSRMNGQILAKKFIVPDISSEKPSIVTDVHETRYKISGYKYPRFIHIISTNSRPGVKVSNKIYSKSVVYLNRILKIAPYLKRYDPPPTGSSPIYVTIPIANKGFVSYVYETEASYSIKTKRNQAKKYILALNKLNLSIN